MKKIFIVLTVGIALVLAGCDKEKSESSEMRSKMRCYHCAICDADLCEAINIIDAFSSYLGGIALDDNSFYNPRINEIWKSWWHENSKKYSESNACVLPTLGPLMPKIHWMNGHAFMFCDEHSRDTYRVHQKDAATDENELRCQVCGKLISVDIRQNKHGRLELVRGHWYPCCSACYTKLGVP